MAGESGTEAHRLEQRLAEAPWKFDFFQAIRRIDNARPGLPPTGHSKRPVEDPVRFCQEPSLAFAPSTLSAWRRDVGTRAPRMFVNFLGLLGPNGPMMLHLTQYIRDRERNSKDPCLARFLDVFNHRMIALLYRAWATNQQAVQFERGDDDHFAMYVGSLFGLGMPSLRGRDAVPDVAKLHYSGHLVCHTRHPDGLCQLLAGYYGVRVEMAEFVGQWLGVPDECRCRLGESPDTGCLGRSVIVGARMWDVQERFRLRFGPMTFAQYERLLPGGDSLRRLLAWVKLYLCDELTWEAQLILRKEEVPPLKLGAGGRLGWTTWLTSRPMPRDADDLVLQPGQAEGK